MTTSASRQIARSMVEIIPLVMRVMAAEMRKQGQLPSHAPILGMLAMRKHTLGELADRHAVSAPTMSNTITTMEERGWVIRTRSEEDRRVVWIDITANGRTALEALQGRTAERIAGMLDRLTVEEQESLARGVAVLQETFITALAADPHLHDLTALTDAE